MTKAFSGFDVTDFWENSDYARSKYVEAPLTAKMISEVEAELGVKLPPSYVELMKLQNGGIPKNTAFPTKSRTTWAADHVAISGIFGIGRTQTYSLCGGLGSRFMQEEWGYPDIGICICACPSAGHDMIMLDYRNCGPEGEPEVVHVDQELDYKITFLAKTFEAFVRGLVSTSVYDTSTEALINDLKKVRNGSFSTLLTELISKTGKMDFERILRKTCLKLTAAKGCFALHADADSHFVYDILFYLYTASRKIEDEKEFPDIYEDLVAFGDGKFSTDGYAPGFVEDWLAKRIKKNQIVKTGKGLAFSAVFRKELVAKMAELQSPP